MKCIIFLLAFFSAFSASGQVKIGDVIGTLVNQYGEPVLFAHAFIEDSLENRYQTKTDPDGRFKIQGVPVGFYTLHCRTFNDTLDVEEINVPWDGLYDCGEIIMQQNIIICKIPTPPGLMYELLPRFPTDYLEITESDFDECVLRFEMQQLIESSSSRIQLTQEEGSMSMQGSRGDVQYFIDGVKVRGRAQLPTAAIFEIRAYHAGAPANFGDTNGGVITIRTKGYFDLYNEWIGE